MKYLLVPVLFAAVVAGALVGGLYQIDVNDATLLDVLAKVQPKINERLNSIYLYRIGKITRAFSQVVDGVNYVVEFELGQTECLKQNSPAIETCYQFTNVELCKAKIYARPWEKIVQLNELNCQPKFSDNVPPTEPEIPEDVPDHSIAGSKHNISTTDEMMLQVLNSVQPQMSNALNSPYVHVVSKVTEAYEQVVAGLKYYITFELAETKCMKSQSEQDQGCRQQPYTRVHTCNAEIWSQPWLSHTELLDFQCSN